MVWSGVGRFAVSAACPYMVVGIECIDSGSDPIPARGCAARVAAGDSRKECGQKAARAASSSTSASPIFKRVAVWHAARKPSQAARPFCIFGPGAALRPALDGSQYIH